MYNAIKNLIFRKLSNIYHYFFHYDNLDNFLNHANPAEKMIWKKIHMLLKNRNNFSILEIGCVNGRNLILSNKYLNAKNKNIKYVGIDLNKKAINKDMEYLKKNFIKNIKLLNINLSKINEINQDYLVICSVLIYLSEQEFLKLLKKAQLARIKKIFIFDNFSKNEFFCKRYYYHNLKQFNFLKKNYMINKKKIDYKPWDTKKTQTKFIILTLKR